MSQYPSLALVASYFPDFEKWLERAGSPTKYMQEAEGELAKMPSLAIERACRKLMREDMPRTSRLPFEVARLARRIAAAMEVSRWKNLADGQETTRCKLCQDTGYVNVLNPETVAETLRTRELPTFPYEAVVFCSCGKGRILKDTDDRAEPRIRRGLPVYDPKRHVLRECGVLPMDQYRAILGDRAEIQRMQGRPRQIVKALAERTTIQE